MSVLAKWLGALGVALACAEGMTTGADAAVVSHWVGDGPGNWNDPSRWDNGVPGVVGTVAVLGESAGERQITLHGGVPVSQLRFNSDQPYTLVPLGYEYWGTGGYGNIIGDWSASPGGEASPVRIEVTRGSHAIRMEVAGSSLADIRIAPGAFLSIERVVGRQLDVGGGGQLTTHAIGPWGGNFQLTVQRFSTVIARDRANSPAVGGFSTWYSEGAAADIWGTLAIQSEGATDRPKLAGVFRSARGAGTISLATAAGMRPAGLTFEQVPAVDGGIDLGRGLATFAVASTDWNLYWQVKGGNQWPGIGIYSSATGSNGPTGAEALALVPGTLLDPWREALTGYLLGSAVVYTYLGDANVDGVVDDADRALMEIGLSREVGPYPGWQYGDFNYDGWVDGTDVALYEFGRQVQGRPLGMAALVPEAGGVGWVVAIGMGLGRRRRR